MLIGHLGGDPEIRHTQDGRAVATFSLATSERWTDKATGEKRERTEWHRIVVFNEHLIKGPLPYLKKGSKAYIEGSLGTRKYTDKAGIERSITEVVLKVFNGTIVLLDRAERHAPEQDEYGTSAARSPSAATGAPQRRDDLDDEIPF